MKIFALTILIALLLAHLVTSLLAIMQARRFRYLSGSFRKVTWSYSILIGIVDILAFVLFFSIDWE